MQKLIVTEKGKEIIGELISKNKLIQFTKVVLSDFDYGTTDLEKLTSIKNVKQTSLISSISNIDSDTVQIIANFDNSELEEKYYVKALGIYASDNGTEFLFGVSIENENSDCMLPYNGHNILGMSYTINVKVGNASQVSLELNPSAYPTNEQVDYKIQHMIGEIYPKSYIETLLTTSWSLNETKNCYEYDVLNNNITKDMYVTIDTDLETRQKLAGIFFDVNSYDGGFKIESSEPIEDDIEISYVATLTTKDEEVLEDEG